MKRIAIIVVLAFSLSVVGFASAQQRGMKPVGKVPPDLPEIVYRTGWALLIGINKYPGLPAQYQLNYAVADAEAFADLLQRKFGFPESNITVLKNEEATKSNILKNFGSLANADANDCVLVYFSGHGQTIDLPELRGGGSMGFLIPYDAKIDLGENSNTAQYYQDCIGMDELKRISMLIPAKHLLFVLDACYSGLVLKSNRGIEAKIPKYLKKVAKSSTQQMITAGGAGEQSEERPDYGHGVFTYKMLEGLENGIADYDDDGVITGSELGNHLRMTVLRMTDGKQTPQFRMEGEGEFIFMPQVEEKSQKPEVITEIQELTSKATLAVDSKPRGAFVYVDEQRMGETPCTVSLDLGIQRTKEVVVAVSKDGYQTKLARIKLTAGKKAQWNDIELAEIAVRPSETRRPSEPPAYQTEITPIPMGTGGNEITASDGARMALVPAGSFQMGDGSTTHNVNLDAFYIDKYEVTNALYKKFMDATGYKAPTFWRDSSFNAPDQPVVGVCWEDAQAYCRWAGKRLPTEAEWEKAARGKQIMMKYPWGSNITHDNANYFSTGGRDRWSCTAPVGSFDPNGYGLYDMAGNVWEWCADWYDASYYSSSPGQNPEGSSTGSNRVLRGGAWNLNPDYLSVARRYYRSPTSRYNDLGFRCAKDAN